MKYYLATWFLSIASFIHSQPAAITFQEARPAGLVKTLDSLYMPAVHVDSTQAVFNQKLSRN